MCATSEGQGLVPQTPGPFVATKLINRATELPRPCFSVGDPEAMDLLGDGTCGSGTVAV